MLMSDASTRARILPSDLRVRFPNPTHDHDTVPLIIAAGQLCPSARHAATGGTRGFHAYDPVFETYAAPAAALVPAKARAPESLLCVPA